MPTTASTLRKVLIPIALILVLVVGGLYAVKVLVGRPAHQSADGSSVDLEVGKTLPDFELHQFGGKTLKASELPSKVTLVNFWATWCEACVVELPSIMKLREGYLSKGFDVVAVSVDQNPDAILPKAIQKFGFKFPVYFDQDQSLADLFNVEAIPLTVIIDKSRKILLIENGERDWNASDIRSKMDNWLAGT